VVVVAHRCVHLGGTGPFLHSYFKVLGNWKNWPNRGRVSWSTQGL
jgi:hypothetical protein